MTDNLDLDALRAARQEQRAKEGKEAPRFVLGGETFELPPELPYEVAWLWVQADAMSSFRVLLGEEAFERFRALTPSVDDTEKLIEWLDAAYGGSKPGLRAVGSGEP